VIDVMTDIEEDTGRLDAAARWYSELQREDVEVETWDEFLAWERDPLNAAAFRQIQANLAIIDRSLRAGARTAGSGPQAKTPPGSALRKRAWLSGLAAVLSFAALGWWVVSKNTELEPVTFTTLVGEQRTVTLSDGSTITLNTDTSLEVTYSERERRIGLRQGQAFFDVARADVPFHVDAGGSRTTALGTQFDIYAQPGQVAVTLLEGSVVVSESPERERGSVSPERSDTAETRSQMLTPGDRLEIMQDGSQTLSRVEPATALQWRSGILQFDNVTLAEAVAELNRYSETRISVPDHGLASERLSGSFPAGEPEEFVLSLALFLPVRPERSENLITLMPIDPD
jgi:transmembrane sensor